VQVRKVQPGIAPLAVGVLAAVAGISYSSWVLELALRTKVDVIDGYVSELSASDQPSHWLFSAGDLVAGVLMMVVAGCCLLMLRRRAWSVLGWGFLMLFGVAAIGDSLFSMDCAPSTDTACALRERAGRVSFSHQFHDVTSSVVVFAGIAALFSLSVAARRYGWWPALARWAWVLAVVEALTALATLVLMYLGVWLGLAQRVQISVLCLGLLLIAWALLADHFTRPAPLSPYRARPAVPSPPHERLATKEKAGAR
jgi:phage shock protein PspC (stress-responsive transcriptional regulator)